MPPARQLRLAALNIDGVLLNDTFSPVIHHFVVSRGAAYTADVERRIFSQPQAVAGREMAAVTGLDRSGVDGGEALARYFEERAAYLADHPVEVLDGALDLLKRVRSLGLATVCYGGLGKEHFDRFLGPHVDLFDAPHYVCTNDFRPGIREIAALFGLRHDQVLFVDDVARVAEAARELDVAFIGHPSNFHGSFQRQLMREAGVRHVVPSLDGIDEELLARLDGEAANGTCWTGS
ncbi:HAD family hydrolase [Streptomyces sp. NPDC087300]|uniref:HAD family hydrolase n=1 Tax=Streptomyces sp. NPDC087300 TaxID=3365780 RepID=UPI00380CA755